MQQTSRLGNLLNAAAVAISDAQAAAIARSADQNPSASAALLTIGQHEIQTISQIARVLRLSHSTTVRLINGLERGGMLERSRGRDKRETLVSLTPEGKKVYETIRMAQARVLNRLLEVLSADEQRTLETALSSILTVLTLDRESGDHICRFCDEMVCEQDRCPVERRSSARGDA